MENPTTSGPSGESQNNHRAPSLDVPELSCPAARLGSVSRRATIEGKVLNLAEKVARELSGSPTLFAAYRQDVDKDVLAAISIGTMGTRSETIREAWLAFFKLEPGSSQTSLQMQTCPSVETF